MATTQATREFTPPYFPFSALIGLLQRLRERPPSRIDRSYLSWLPGITQTYMMAFLKAVGLIDANLRMTDAMRNLVAADDATEKSMIAELVRTQYADVFALGSNATQSELEEVFRDGYGVKGSTLRKAITFFLKAAEYGGVEVSPLFTTPRRPVGSGVPRKTNRKTRTRKVAEDSTDDDPIDSEGSGGLDALRARYIEMLMKKAEDQTEPELLDRIERLLGYEEVSG
jgi:hypothetical protein